MDPNALLNAMMSGGMRGGSVNEMMSGLAAGQGGGGLGALLRGLEGSFGSGMGGAIGGGMSGRPGTGSGLAPAGASGGMGGGMGGLGDLLGGLLGGLGGGGMGGPSQGGLGGLGGLLGGGGRSSGLAVLAGLAATVLSGLGRGGSDPQRLVQATGQVDPEALEDKAMLMIRAMIAAAKADGTIDAEEQQGILSKLAEAGAGPEERAFVERELAMPLDVDALVADVDDPQTAAEVFTASALAIRVDTVAEQAYLDQLAQRLGLKSH